jgi:hypothetical protein
MATNENDAARASKATQPLIELQELLNDARSSADPARVHTVLIEVLDQLITHAQRQARAIEDLRSDVSHKQGIVTRFDSRDPKAPSKGPASVQNNRRGGDETLD